MLKKNAQKSKIFEHLNNFKKGILI